MRVLISGAQGAMSAEEIMDLLRRRALDGEVGHMKTSGNLTGCRLESRNGDALFAVRCARAHEI